jgi:hypothetical protein
MLAKLLTKWGVYKELDIDHKSLYIILTPLGDVHSFVDHYMFDVPEGYRTFELSGIDIYGESIVIIYKEANNEPKFEEII